MMMHTTRHDAAHHVTRCCTPRDAMLQMGESKVASVCKCRIGMAKGNAQYDEFLSNIATKVSDDV
jgi:hypothetical protein